MDIRKVWIDTNRDRSLGRYCITYRDDEYHRGTKALAMAVAESIATRLVDTGVDQVFIYFDGAEVAVARPPRRIPRQGEAPHAIIERSGGYGKKTKTKVKRNPYTGRFT